MTRDSDSAILRGQYFEATITTITDLGPVETLDVEVAAEGPLRVMLRRVRVAVDDLLRGLADSHPAAWPIMPFAPATQSSNVVPLARFRFQLDVASRTLGAVSIRVCFARQPAPDDLEALKRKLAAVINRVPSLRQQGTWDESQGR